MSRHRQFNKELDDFLENDVFEDFSDEDLEKLAWASTKVKNCLKDISHVKQEDIYHALINNCFDIDKACSWIKQKQLKDTLRSPKTFTSKKGLISLNEDSLSKNISEAHSDLKMNENKDSFKNNETSIQKQSKLSALANSKHKLSSNISNTSLKSVSLLSHLTKTKFSTTNDTKNNKNEQYKTDLLKNPMDYNIPLKTQVSLKKNNLNKECQKKDSELLNDFFFKKHKSKIEVKPSEFALSIFGKKILLSDSFYKLANQRFSLFAGVLDNRKPTFHEASNLSKTRNKKEKGSKPQKTVSPTDHSEASCDNNELHHKLSSIDISSEHENRSIMNFDEPDGLNTPLIKTSEFKIDNEKKKDNVNIIIIGHADAGKSTLLGRLLYDLKVIDTKALEKLKHEADKLGKSSFYFAWVLDQTSEERSRGVTMDIGINYFETPLRKYTILDAPGHKDFIHNMIAGATHADLALLVIDSSLGSFESGFMSYGQTREHIILVRSLGIQKIIVAINKLETTIWSQQRYEEIKSQLLQFFIYKGFQKLNILFIPCSGLTGENLTKTIPLSTELKSWYSGPTLLEALENVPIEHQQLDAPLRLCIMDIYKSTNSLTSIFGKIETGMIHVGEDVIIMPSREKGTIKSIYVHDNIENSAFSGDGVLINLLNVDPLYLKPGDIICDFKNPIQTVLKFRARIVTFELSRPLIVGSPLVIHRGRLNVDANIKKLIALIDKSTGEIKKEKPKLLIGSFDAAIVEIEFCKQPEPMETFKQCKKLGRFIIRFQGETIAAGIVEDEQYLDK
ncbi:hypothetical protein PORY_001461 [Pneumocystis oryctolagi]|uniref:Uncharacterized protein n=1 Tax=Pneumocystis oryctolagi TaxID=42067 RepID=A0ACB7CCK8_9ASCO|nr:hypothetical protein PORY_001461 [Pneumocystis oryctolagi]